MRKIIRRGIISSLILALSLCSIACNSSNSSKQSETDKKISEQQTEAKKNDTEPGKQVEENPDPFGKYDPPITITFARTVDDDLASNILPKTPGETIESNRWLDLYSEKLGINIKYDWTVRGGLNDDAYMQKLNVTLASGNLPDVTIVDRTQLKQLSEAAQIWEMTEYWEKYASELSRDVYTMEGDGVLTSATFDGKLMAVPYADASVEGTQYMWLRKDWLDKLGLSVPTTMSEFLKVAEAFTNNDPDGNGANDTYALALTKNLYGGAMGSEGFFAGFHAYPNFWQERDGKLVWGSVQPEVKDALKALAQMYKEGQLDPEFGIKEGSKVAESIANGKFGMDFGEQWNPMYPLISNYNNDPKADWTGYALVSNDEKPVRVPQKFRTNWYYAVSKKCEHPEAVVKLVNMHLETNWGKDNQFEKYYMPMENDNVGVWKFSPVTPFPPNKNLDAFNAIEAARKAGDMSTLTGEAAVIQRNLEAFEAGDTSQWGWDKIYGPNGVFHNLNNYIANNQIMREKFVGAPTPTMIERQSTLEKMEKEVFIKIIMGEVPLDDFDKFVNDWNELGGEAMTKEVNEWYESVK